MGTIYTQQIQMNNDDTNQNIKNGKKELPEGKKQEGEPSYTKIILKEDGKIDSRCRIGYGGWRRTLLILGEPSAF